MSCPSPETPLPSDERAPSLGHFSVWANTAWLDRPALPEASDNGREGEKSKARIDLDMNPAGQPDLESCGTMTESA